MAPIGNQTAADCDKLHGKRHLTEALAWADMEDDEPTLLLLADLVPATCLARSDLLQPCSAPEVCKPLSPIATSGTQAISLVLTRGARDSVPPPAAAGVRTPLSAKSRPFISRHGVAPSLVSQRAHSPAGKADLGEGGTQTGMETETRTTVMLRGLPSTFSRKMLVGLLHAHGYSGQFDFVYLPVHFETFDTQGYAFVNLTQPAAAERFRAFFEDFNGHPFSALRPSGTSWSRLQGLEANVEKYRSSYVMCEHVPEECRPLLFREGLPRPFPEPAVKRKGRANFRWRRSVD
ncbi:unnamed protein product [Prorocentrum cordatum]|uniref:RRM domain-containing protein n=1 Tax=Prorocentrum cordatum TaxID=2364126 RepID=A0ABN9XSY6_9DINO|nr:unnamed protein product [Polarella glacialis]